MKWIESDTTYYHAADSEYWSAYGNSDENNLQVDRSGTSQGIEVAPQAVGELITILKKYEKFCKDNGLI